MRPWLDVLYDVSVVPEFALFREPRQLDVSSSAGTTYRFLTLPSFRPPTVIRLDAGDSHWQIAAKRLMRESLASTRVWSKRRTLREREQREVGRLLAELNLWELPENGDTHGLDGETWILEARSADRYHVIERWCPERPSTFATLGDYLLILTRMPNDYSPPMGGEWRRGRLEERRRSARAAEEREQARLTAVSARNVLASALATELEARGLRCPRCQRHSRDIRYVHGRTDCEWYFICRACGGSFTARDYDA